MRMPDKLRKGYERFRRDRYAGANARNGHSTRCQSPRTMIIGCVDCRVDPATMFSAEPGELLIVRNIAALVPRCQETVRFQETSAALELAVTSLGVETIVVLGHGMCDGVAAALNQRKHQPVGRFIRPWVEALKPLVEELEDSPIALSSAERQRALERMAVQESLESLLTYSFVSERVEAGKLTLHGAWYSSTEHELHWLDWDSGVFEPVPLSQSVAGAKPARSSLGAAA